jgi:mannuronan 5-epimerase
VFLLHWRPEIALVIIVLLTFVVFALFITFSTISSIRASSMSDSQPSETNNSLLPNATPDCITFDSEERVITITCKTTDLTQIDSALRVPDILQSDANVDKGWILNSGITVAQNAILYINSSDTSWLKIVSDEENAYPIHVSGSLKIDSVGITSWNPNTNNYTSSLDSQRDGQDVQIGTPRPLYRSG